MSVAIGIDLGTTNTVVAAVQNGRPEALADESGQALIPSVVSFLPSGAVLVGETARERRSVDPKNTVFSVKRLMGRTWDTEEVRHARTRFPFELREGPGRATFVVVRGETYTLPEISAFVLRKAKSIAEQALGESVERAVLTVPANFNDLQRAATKVAGRVTGLEILRILNEPTAAALASGLAEQGAQRVAVYDFGGGTFDVTLLTLNDAVFEVLSTAGSSFLGGDDIDQAIADRIAEQMLSSHGQDPRSTPEGLEQLRSAAETLKIRLGTETEVKLDVPAIRVGQAEVKVDFSMTRAELHRLALPFVNKTLEVCQQALGMAHLGVSDLSHVLLVGGTTRMPLVRTRVEEFFRRAPVASADPHQTVALGAALHAASLTQPRADAQLGQVPPAPAHVPLPAPLEVAATGPNRPVTRRLGARRVTSPGLGEDDSLPSALSREPSLQEDGWQPALPAQPPAPMDRRFTELGSSPADGFGTYLPSIPDPTELGSEAEFGRPPDTLSGLGLGGDAGELPLPAVPAGRFPKGRPPAVRVARGTDSARSPASPPVTDDSDLDDVTVVRGSPAELAAAADLPAPVPAPRPAAGASNQLAADLPELAGPTPTARTQGASPVARAAQHTLPLSVVDVPAPIARPRQDTVPLSEDLPSPVATPPGLVGSPLADSARPPPSEDELRARYGDLPLIVGGKRVRSRVSDRPPALSPPAASDNLPSTGQQRSFAQRQPEALHAPLPPVDPTGAVSVQPILSTPRRTAGIPAARPAAPPLFEPESPAASLPRPPVRTGASTQHGLGKPMVPHRPSDGIETLDDSDVADEPRTSQPAAPRASMRPLARQDAAQEAALPVPDLPLVGTAPPVARTPLFSQPPGAIHTSASTGTKGQTIGLSAPTQTRASPATAPGPKPRLEQTLPLTAASSAVRSAPSQAPAARGLTPAVATIGLGGDLASTASTRSEVTTSRTNVPLLIDVTPLSLRVETAGGYSDVLIERNTPVPCERTREFVTVANNQDTAWIRVSQGEAPLFSENTVLGEVQLNGLAPAQRGSARIAVTFGLDTDGLLNVRAVDLATGRAAAVELRLFGGTSPGELSSMMVRHSAQIRRDTDRPRG